MSECDNIWALALAAGDGRRLRELTTTRTGLAIPKQFCSLERGPSLLREAIARAAAIAAPGHICTIVAAQRKRWWREQVEDLDADNVIVQPKNRGTAIGLLLPQLTILQRDPDARIHEAVGRGSLAALYEALPDLDFSRAILQGQERHLWVLPVADCGWSDLGTPERVAAALDALPRLPRSAARAPAARDVLLSLAAQAVSRGCCQLAAAGGG